MLNFGLNAAIFLLIPTCFFTFADHYFYLDRGMISLDILALVFIRKIISNSLISFALVLLFLIDLFTSLSDTYFFNRQAFYESIKYFFVLPHAYLVLSICVIAVIALYLTVAFCLRRSSITLRDKVIFGVICSCIISVEFRNNSTQFSPRGKVSADLNLATSGVIRNITLFMKHPSFSSDTMFNVTTPIRESMLSIGNGLASKSIDKRPNVILIIMESFGINSDTNKYNNVIHPLQMLPSDKFDVCISRNKFYGNTENAETRELLGAIIVPYTSVVRSISHFVDGSIPHLFSEFGYATVGIHGFSGQNFDRYIWWKQIGFQQCLFVNDFLKEGYSPVGNLFRGIFDLDILDYMQSRQIDFQRQNKPFFMYFLTLNTHLPLSKNIMRKFGIIEVPSTNQSSGYIDSMQIKILTKICEIVNNSSNTIFYITGDHAPRLSGKEKGLYNKSYVPSIVIQPREYKIALQSN